MVQRSRCLPNSKSVLPRRRERPLAAGRKDRTIVILVITVITSFTCRKYDVQASNPRLKCNPSREFIVNPRTKESTTSELARFLDPLVRPCRIYTVYTLVTLWRASDKHRNPQALHGRFTASRHRRLMDSFIYNCPRRAAKFFCGHAPYVVIKKPPIKCNVDVCRLWTTRPDRLRIPFLAQRAYWKLS